MKAGSRTRGLQATATMEARGEIVASCSVAAPEPRRWRKKHGRGIVNEVHSRDGAGRKRRMDRRGF